MPSPYTQSILKMCAIAAILLSAGLAAAWASIWDEANSPDQAIAPSAALPIEDAKPASFRRAEREPQSSCPETGAQRGSAQQVPTSGGCCPTDAPADGGCSEH